MRDQTWRDLPLGGEVALYLRHKSNRLTPASHRIYEGTLAALAHYYPATTLEEFEPPAGTRLLEDFLDGLWGDKNPRTYNKNLTVLRDFFKRCVLRGNLHGDPTLPIERAKARAFHRSTFTTSQINAILEANLEPRYQVALRLLLDYGIRKGALANVRFEHFDIENRCLVIFTKGGKVQKLWIPQDTFWKELALIDAKPSDYLLCKQRVQPASPRTRARVRELAQALDEICDEIRELGGHSGSIVLDCLEDARALIERPGLIGERVLYRTPGKPLGEHAIHDLWYRCLVRAGIVAEGVTRGERIHKARHSSAQRIIDSTGNLLATKEVLGHQSSATTENYVEWGEQMMQTLLTAIPERTVRRRA